AMRYAAEYLDPCNPRSYFARMKQPAKVHHSTGERLKVAALFAGVGGIELGLHQAGHVTTLFCELDPGASRVLTSRFSTDVTPDVREIETVGNVDLVTAGFPCQDLSQAGMT